MTRILHKWLHELMWLIFISGTCYAYFHHEIMNGNYTDLDRSFQMASDFFLWMMGVGVWILVYWILSEWWVNYNEKERKDETT